MIPIKHRKLKQLAERHWQLISQRRIESFTQGNYEDVCRWFEDKNLSFEGIVKAKPQELKRLKNLLFSNRYDAEIEKLKDLYSNFAKKSSQFGTTQNPYNAYYLVKSLDLSVCPYCNRNFIRNLSDKRASELDHFYPKEKHPFLAVSFYNLIPSCKLCNWLKREDLVSLNPYDENFDFQKVIFQLKINSVDFIYNEQAFDLMLDDSQEIKENIDKLKLNEHYQNHKDIVLDLIQKSVVYNDSYVEELFRTYEGTFFRNKEDVLRLITSNFISEDDLHKRPLAKLTKDISEELGLI